LRDREDICFLLVGGGAAKAGLEAMIAERSLTNIRTIPYQPRDHLAESLSAADLHVISMHPEITGCLMPRLRSWQSCPGKPMLLR